MITALRSQRFTAALDVFTPEPLPKDNELWTLKNLIVTPHVGGATRSFFHKGIALLEENLPRMANGLEPLNVIRGEY